MLLHMSGTPWIDQEDVLADVTGKEVQPPMIPHDPGQGAPHPPLPVGPSALSLGPGPTDHQGPPPQHQATFEQPQVGGQAAGPSRKRPKSLSPAPAAAQVLHVLTACKLCERCAATSSKVQSQSADSLGSSVGYPRLCIFQRMHSVIMLLAQLWSCGMQNSKALLLDCKQWMDG